MRAARRSPWRADFDYGVMVLAQTGIPTTFWFHRSWISVRKDKFYSKKPVESLEPFGMETMATAFLVFASGVAISSSAFVFEIFKERKKKTN